MNDQAKTNQGLLEENALLKQRIQELEQSESEHQQVAEETQKEQDLNRMLLDTLPHPAMMISRDRKVRAMNKVAEGAGVTVGSFCWEGFGKCAYIPEEKAEEYKSTGQASANTFCSFCKADQCLKNKDAQNDPKVHAFERTWDTYWIAIDSNLYLHYAIDITGSERAEEELRESEERYRTLFEQARDSILLLDLSLDGMPIILDANDSALRMHGYSRDELIGKPVAVLDAEESPASLVKERVDQIKTADGMVFETRHLRKDGTTFDCEISVKMINDCLAIDITRDITERKQAEEQLRESEEKFRLAFQANPDSINVNRLEDGLYVDINQGFTDLNGYTREDVIGRTSLELNIWHDPADRERLVQGLRERGVYDNLEAQFHKKDGSLTTGLMSARVLMVGKVPHIVSITRDITERKRAEEERAKLEGQLQQAQKMESVGRLAGGVAHDFNNMLGAILGHAELALLQVDPAQPLQAHLEEIQKAARRSADLTRQLLAFARKQTITPEVLDLNETVKGMIKMLKRLIGEDIDLAWQPEADLWPVKMDPSQIDQILANLCVNSRDAIVDVGKVTIETGNITFDEAYCADHAGFVPGEYVLLAVSDNGCGMDQETLANIFEPFFTTKGVGQGTGLGLSTVYGAVKQNNGFINTYSEPGSGTTFKIYLPRHGGKTAQMQPKGPAEPVLRGQETILLVEDEPAILNMTTIMLERQGYTVLAAITPGQAIRLAEAHPGVIDLVMTDVIMPEMNGRDLAKNLLSLYPHLKRLFMSGYTANVIAHHGVLDPGVHFIQKPFSIQRLAAKVREALDSK